MTHTANNELTTGPGARFTPGELVDVTIRGARVGFERDLMPGWVAVDVAPDWHALIDTSRAIVTRVAPAEWPPQPADVWKDREGYLWSAIGDAETGNVEMLAVLGGRGAIWSDPAEVLAEFGPMRLMYRAPKPSRVVEIPIVGLVDETTGRIVGDPTMSLPVPSDADTDDEIAEEIDAAEEAAALAELNAQASDPIIIRPRDGD